MKTVKIILATILFALTIVNASAVSSDAVLSEKNQKTLDSITAKASAWNTKNITVLGKQEAEKRLQTAIEKLKDYQMSEKVKKSDQNYTLVYKLRVFCEGLLKKATSTTPVVVAPVVVPPVVAPTTTKQLTQVEAKKVDTVTATIDSQTKLTAKDLPLIQKTQADLQSIGLSENDSRLLTLKSEAGDGFTFCANFTAELYPVEALYQNAQSANSKEFDKYRLKVIYMGDTWLQSNNPTLYNARDTQYVRALRCANVMYGYQKTFGVKIDQAYVKNLFDKLGQTYTVQTKAFYDQGIDAKDLVTWINGLGNGKIK